MQRGSKGLELQLYNQGKATRKQQTWWNMSWIPQQASQNHHLRILLLSLGREGPCRNLELQWNIHHDVILYRRGFVKLKIVHPQAVKYGSHQHLILTSGDVDLLLIGIAIRSVLPNLKEAVQLVGLNIQCQHPPHTWNAAKVGVRSILEPPAVSSVCMHHCPSTWQSQFLPPWSKSLNQITIAPPKDTSSQLDLVHHGCLELFLSFKPHHWRISCHCGPDRNLQNRPSATTRSMGQTLHRKRRKRYAATPGHQWKLPNNRIQQWHFLHSFT